MWVVGCYFKWVERLLFNCWDVVIDFEGNSNSNDNNDGYGGGGGSGDGY